MSMKGIEKYRACPPVQMKTRRWPARTIEQAPRWCSVDLRDGNQALRIPMGIAAKTEMFAALVAIGFKEIEVGFPAASETEYRFLRTLIEDRRIPADVSIQVLTQARDHLIRRTVEALAGSRGAIIHLYNSTSELQRRVVFRKDRAAIREIAVEGARLVMEAATRAGLEDVRFEYSPESFTGTELDFALEVSHAVMDVWQPTRERPMILNLPATVEMATPNMYADQIEWMSEHLRDRASIVVSLHAHNDRGTAVAASELALMAGADRVEGTLFGNGERTGNADIVTLALNLYSQGIDPGLDFSRINEIRAMYERTTGMTIHERHPYVGEFVYTAFSGSHQDAIKKGMDCRERVDAASAWEVPYLPLDPADVGRSYEAIIRINSQSGKGGVAYVLSEEHGFQLPKEMQPEFSTVVQQWTDRTGAEATPDVIKRLFAETYFEGDSIAMLSCSIKVAGGRDARGEKAASVEAAVIVDGREQILRGEGNGPIDAFVHALAEGLGEPVEVTAFSEHALASGSDARAVAYLRVKGRTAECYGVGVAESIDLASYEAILSAMRAGAR
jgi:2-isopropylmalate synthase